MNLVHHVLGSFDTNVYVLADDETSETLVIDPGADCERLAEDLEQAGLKLKYIAVTHGHGDHTGAVATLKNACGGEFVAHRGDRGQIEIPPPWITTMMPGFVDPPPIDRFIEDGDMLHLGNLAITVIATPGHTPGSVCYLHGDVVFTGDTLFQGNIGRHDLPGGDGDLEIRSIKTRLLTLPAETRVLPGHGPASSIGEEASSNPFLR